MVIETNNEACAQLQLALHTRWSPCPRSNFGTLGPHQLSRFILSWSISIDSHKDKSGRSNLRSVSKSTPDPPDACSKEWAHTNRRFSFLCETVYCGTKMRREEMQERATDDGPVNKKGEREKEKKRKREREGRRDEKRVSSPM